jgi:hypothetical protein
VEARAEGATGLEPTRIFSKRNALIRNARDIIGRVSNRVGAVAVHINQDVADGAARPPPTGASSSSRGGKPGGNRPRTMPQDGEREARLVSRVNTSL